MRALSTSRQLPYRGPGAVRAHDGAEGVNGHVCAPRARPEQEFAAAQAIHAPAEERGEGNSSMQAASTAAAPPPPSTPAKAETQTESRQGCRRVSPRRSREWRARSAYRRPSCQRKPQRRRRSPVLPAPFRWSRHGRWGRSRGRPRLKTRRGAGPSRGRRAGSALRIPPQGGRRRPVFPAERRQACPAFAAMTARQART